MADHRGVDVSSNNRHPINWKALYDYLKAQGGGAEPFVIIKTTESTFYTNPDAATDVAGARQAGFRAVAAYLFDHGNANVQAEEDYARARSFGLPIFTDIEYPAGLSAADYAAHARSLVAIGGQTLEYLNQAEVAEGFPADRLWLAQYNGVPGVTKYPCLMHQYLSTGRVPSITDDVFDFNAWRGTEVQFAQFFDLAVPAPSTPPVPLVTCVGLATTRDEAGYWLVESNLAITAKGDAAGPSQGPAKLVKPVVGVCGNPGGTGFWAVAADGGIFCEQGAGFYGSAGNAKLAQPAVGMAAHPSGRGYWIAAADGGVFNYGASGFHGSAGDVKLAQPVVGIASSATGNGYWLVAADGGVFSYGDAAFRGSLGGHALAAPIVGIAATPDGNGYWIVGSDGGVFTFGSARFFGSTGNVKLAAPIVSIIPSHSGNGYHLVAKDGGVFCFGDAKFEGSGA